MSRPKHGNGLGLGLKACVIEMGTVTKTWYRLQIGAQGLEVLKSTDCLWVTGLTLIKSNVARNRHERIQGWGQGATGPILNLIGRAPLPILVLNSSRVREVEN